MAHPLIGAKQAFTDEWLNNIVISVREMIEALPALYKLPAWDKEAASIAGARHLLLAVRSRSIAELDCHHP
jgi:hypothetical protein